jgi:hypothetical protein
MGTEVEFRISAVVSSTTRTLLEEHARATGVKKGRLIEEAILHHLSALDALPADIIVHPRIVISRRSGQEVVQRTGARLRPTSRLRALMSKNED